MFLQLYFRGRGTPIGNRYGPGTGPILMDELRCVGNETSIAECRHRGWYSHNCDHGEDVSVSCNTSSGSEPSSMWYYASFFLATLCWRSMTLCLSVKVRSHRMRCGALRHRAACFVVFCRIPHTVLTNLHKPVLYQKCWLKRSSWFWRVGFPRLMLPVLCVEK